MAGHELAHAIVSHHNQIQAFIPGFYFAKASCKLRRLDVNADFYNPSQQETDIDEFILHWAKQRCRKIHYEQYAILKNRKCEGKLLCYKSEIQDFLSAMRKESSDDESDDNEADRTHEVHAALE